MVICADCRGFKPDYSCKSEAHALFPGANQEEIRTFREYIERQVTTNRDLMERLLRARHFQEAFRIQVEYFQSQLRTAAVEATQIGAWIEAPMHFFG